MLHKTDGISLTVFGSFLRTFAANYKKTIMCGSIVYNTLKVTTKARLQVYIKPKCPGLLSSVY